MGIFSILGGRLPAQASNHVECPPDTFPMKAVGESRYQNALVAICRPYTEDGRDDGYEATIERTPSDRYDADAVLVKIHGRMVGYLPRQQAVRVSNQMRKRGIHRATCHALVRGGWHQTGGTGGQYGVRLAIPAHGPIGFDG